MQTVAPRTKLGLTPEQKSKMEELLNKLPESVRIAAKRDPEGLATALMIEVKNRAKNFPSIDFIPNIAQERALKCLAAPHESYGNYPKLIGFCAANGIGKTCCIAAILLPGMCLGPEFVNRQYCNWQFFYDCAKIRKKRKLLIRIVCDAKDMKEDGGSMYQQIKKWIPTAKFKDKTGDFYQTVVIGDVNIDVKTHSMDVIAHAGPDYDMVIFNEPPPKAIYEENISRTRSGGRASIFMTPLNEAAYLREEITNPEGPEGESVFTEGNIWENAEYIEGTRGTLKKDDIEFLVRKWKRQGKHVFEARAYGKFGSFAGVIFPIFSISHHIVNPAPIPKNWNFYMLLDPHEVKPPFVIWIAKSPMNQTFVIAEYPDEQWNQVTVTTSTIKSFCADFDFIEKGRSAKFPYMPTNVNWTRIGDPNRMNVYYPNSGLTINQEYAQWGYDFDVTANDDITIGHDRIRELIEYDVEREVDSRNCSKLYIYRGCKNVQSAFMNYKINEKGAIEEEWKCPMDLIRYYCDKSDPWTNRGSASNSKEYDDYDEIEAGRNPFRFKSVSEDEFVTTSGRW